MTNPNKAGRPVKGVPSAAELAARFADEWGVTDKSAAALIGVTGGAVSTWRNNHKLKCEACGKMNDQELLEFSAKAVNGGAWHPLTDDGGAFRLHVHCYREIGTEYIELFEEFLQEELSNNPSYACACFRRAITRAAAEIGKGMK